MTISISFDGSSGGVFLGVAKSIYEVGNQTNRRV